MTVDIATIGHPLDGASKAGRKELLNRFVDLAERIGRPIVLLAPRIHFDRDEIAFLLAHPLMRSLILFTNDRALADIYPGRIGYVADENSVIRLPGLLTADIVVVGHLSEIGVRAAWSAWRAGVRRLHLVRRYHPHRAIPIWWIAVKCLVRAALSRIARRPVAAEPPPTKSAFIFGLEQWMFARRLRTIEKSSLPIAGAPTDWRPGRIVMVGGSLGPGGAERQLATTMLALHSRGHHDIHFLHHAPMLPPSDFFLPSVTAARIPTAQVDLVGYRETTSTTGELAHRLVPLGDIAGEIGAYVQAFLELRPSIVHIWLDYMNVVAGLAALLVGVPRVVLSCRSLSPVHFAFLQPFMRPIYRLLARHRSVVFLNNSVAGAADYKRWLDAPELAFRVIRNGFDPTAFPDADGAKAMGSDFRRTLGIPAGARVIGSIMRISEEKRPDLWIETAIETARIVPDAHFLLVGDGPLRAAIETRARQALAGRIHFPGHRRDIAAALAAMDIFLLTSRVEGLPNVLIEAQFVGIPVVTVDCGGASEALDDGVTGLVVRSALPDALAAALASRLNDPEWMARARATAPGFVKATFGMDRMLDELRAVYGRRDPA